MLQKLFGQIDVGDHRSTVITPQPMTLAGGNNPQVHGPSSGTPGSSVMAACVPWWDLRWPGRVRSSRAG